MTYADRARTAQADLDAILGDADAEIATLQQNLTTTTQALETTTAQLADLKAKHRVWPGFTQRLFEDFTTPCPPGQVYTDPYYSKVVAGYGNDGRYRTSNVEVADGSLILSAPGGTKEAPSTGAVVVLGGWGWTYGAAEVRYRAEGLAGTGLAGMLWPQGGWDFGEVDVIEAVFDQAGRATAKTFVHPTPCTGDKAKATATVPYCGINVATMDTGATFRDWRTSRVEWTPDRLRFLLDGQEYLVTTQGVGNAKRRLTWQLADPQKGGVCAPGRVLIDYFRLDTHTP